MMSKLYPVVMAGGIGSRLWPLSRHDAPKQLQPLVTDQTMLAETIARVPAQLDGAALMAPIIVCGGAHADAVEAELAKSTTPGGTIITEPVGRNTAPVAIIASLHVAQTDPQGLVLLMPADQHVVDTPAFAAALNAALPAARDGRLVTFGIKPTRPETGYGYIRAGKALADTVYAVDGFVEKPDQPTAQSYIDDGQYSWNAGLFLFRADVFLDQARIHAPNITAAAAAAFDASPLQGQRRALDPGLFADVPADSIDYAVMEKTDMAALVGPVEMGWSDIGSWQALHELSNEDRQTRCVGDVIAHECDGSYIRSDGPMVAAIGVKDLVIVATGDAVLVVPADRTQDVKRIVEDLKRQGRKDLL